MRQQTANYKLLGLFAPTFYRILDESAPEWTTEERTEALLTMNGELIAFVTQEFRRQLDIEGSARLSDGRVINFHHKMRGAWRYLIAHDAPFGLGVEGYKLVPYRTLAVDPQVIEFGSVLYLPALEGFRLPSCEIHDGFIFAHDEGQGITGHRIDVFVGFEPDVDNTLTRSARLKNMTPVDVYEVDKETADRLNAKYRRQFAL